MTYSNATKVWTGQFNVGTLPKLVNTSTYEVIVSSHDKASPANSGFATLHLPATLPVAASPATEVSTTTATSVSTTFFVAVSTSLRTISAVPLWAYAGIVVIVVFTLLVLGVVVGYLLRKKPAV
jgi:hypothetical protein